MEPSQEKPDDVASQSSTTHTHVGDPTWFNDSEIETMSRRFDELGYNAYEFDRTLPQMSEGEQADFEDKQDDYGRSVIDLACHPDGATFESCVESKLEMMSCLAEREHPDKSLVMDEAIIPDIFYAYIRGEKPAEPLSQLSLTDAKEDLTRIIRVLEGVGERTRDLQKELQLADGWMERLTNARIKVGFSRHLDAYQLFAFFAMVKGNILCNAEKEGPPKDITSVAGSNADGSALSLPNVS
jgi:hypothetical protein